MKHYRRSYSIRGDLQTFKQDNWKSCTGAWMGNCGVQDEICIISCMSEKCGLLKCCLLGVVDF